MIQHHFDIVKHHGASSTTEPISIETLVHALYENNLWFDRNGCTIQTKNGVVSYSLKNNLTTILIDSYDQCPYYVADAKRTGMHVLVETPTEDSVMKVQLALLGVYKGGNIEKHNGTDAAPQKKNGSGKDRDL